MVCTLLIRHTFAPPLEELGWLKGAEVGGRKIFLKNPAKNLVTKKCFAYLCSPKFRIVKFDIGRLNGGISIKSSLTER